MSKRLFDLTVLLLLAPFWIPLLVLVAFCNRIALGKPIVFQQIRPGKGGRPFRIVKFRTMSESRDAQGALLPDEQRLTPFGKFLRATSLDELPEILNVIRGEMSLVGPRPLLMQYLRLYTPRQARRHDVLPGITGWAQVNGRNALSWEQKFELDVWYVENRSLWLDLRILALTVVRLFSREGINAPGHATAPFFEGTANGDAPLLKE